MYILIIYTCKYLNNTFIISYLYYNTFTYVNQSFATDNTEKNLEFDVFTH